MPNKCDGTRCILGRCTLSSDGTACGRLWCESCMVTFIWAQVCDRLDIILAIEPLVEGNAIEPSVCKHRGRQEETRGSNRNISPPFQHDPSNGAFHAWGGHGCCGNRGPCNASQCEARSSYAVGHSGRPTRAVVRTTRRLPVFRCRPFPAHLALFVRCRSGAFTLFEGRQRGPVGTCSDGADWRPARWDSCRIYDLAGCRVATMVAILRPSSLR